MLSSQAWTTARINPRLLNVVQWASLVPMAASLMTQDWYEHEWTAFFLVAIAAAAWAPDLRRGERRWWFVYAAGLFIYEMLRSHADTVFGIPVRMTYTTRFDQMLFGGIEPVVWLQSRLFDPPNVGPLDFLATLTHWSFFIVPHALAAVIYIWRREHFSRYVIMLVAIEYIALIGFLLVPTAPPWLVAQYGQIDHVYRVMDFVGGKIDPETYQALYTAQAEPNAVAAMPSLHMAITFATYLAVRRYYPSAAPVFLVYSALMAVSLVLLAEHFVLDLIVGALIAFVVDQAIERWTSRHRASRRAAAVALPARKR